MRTTASQQELHHLYTLVLNKYNTEHSSDRIKEKSKTPSHYEGITKIINGIASDFQQPKNPLRDDYSTEHSTRLQFSSDQVARALGGGVNQPQKAMVDAFYVYVFDVGRNGFMLNPEKDATLANIIETNPETEEEITKVPFQIRRKLVRNAKFYSAVTSLLLILLISASAAFVYEWHVKHLLVIDINRERRSWDTIKRDYAILRYRPSQAEIDSMTGIWLCFSSSTQARPSIPVQERYHSGARNLMEVRYKNGYFTFMRYSIGFDQVGYMEFESPGIVSIHSHKANTIGDSTVWPKLSLMKLGSGRSYQLAVSASHNFDMMPNDLIIGMREVYKKMGTGGHIVEMQNDGSNVKRVVWEKDGKVLTKFEIKLTRIETMAEGAKIDLTTLLNEKNIILAEPREDVVINRGNQEVNRH